MHALIRCKTWSLYIALALPAFSAGPAMVVDRGLPVANLNNAAGDYRSNVRWSWYENGFLGDDFMVGGAGESWVIDTIRVWTVPGVDATAPQNLGDYYQDVRLYFGEAERGLSPIATGLLTTGSSQSNNPNIMISDATQSSGMVYDNFGANLHIWQIDFGQLNLKVQGGVKYQFGAWGLGRSDEKSGKTYAWFNAASASDLATATQDGADGRMLLFGSGGKFMRAFDGKGAGWDKSSDISVEVFGHRIEGVQNINLRPN